MSYSLQDEGLERQHMAWCHKMLPKNQVGAGRSEVSVGGDFEASSCSQVLLRRGLVVSLSLTLLRDLQALSDAGSV